MAIKARIMKGLPGSGKTTKAEELARLNNTIIISKDILREENPDMKEDDIRKLQNKLIKEASENETNIVVDNTHMNLNTLTSVVEYCHDLGYEVRLFDMAHIHGSEYDYHATAVNRNNKREGKKKVPRSVIDEMFLYEFSTSKVPESSIYVFDIDGTLANGDHRVKHVSDGKKNWKKYFDLMDGDEVIPAVKKILTSLKMLSPFNKIVIVSGRPDTYGDVTEKWLNDNGIPFDYLLMRKGRDNRQDTLVKEDIYERCLEKEHDKIVAVFDDRRSVIDMRKSKGLYVFNCSLLDNNDF